MFFRGLNGSVLSRIAYLLVLLSFVTTPIHYFIHNRNPLQSILLIGSEVILVLGLLVAVFRKPRDWRLVVYALVACVIHGIMSPVL